jgi:hypothetical protein
MRKIYCKIIQLLNNNNKNLNLKQYKFIIKNYKKNAIINIKSSFIIFRELLKIKNNSI